VNVVRFRLCVDRTGFSKLMDMHGLCVNRSYLEFQYIW
jgi:hypothetical protein